MHRVYTTAEQGYSWDFPGKKNQYERFLKYLLNHLAVISMLAKKELLVPLCDLRHKVSIHGHII